ncbi:hypothetical protein FOCC_FOCC003284 [Frankliniella occidentalis]|nr:hypothetical protein FOCC_FOCC003284 [Frankliniella occidentalis]
MISRKQILRVFHPHSWQTSADGTSLIGHMILRKCIREPQGSGGSSSGSSTTSSILGLKVTGGKLLPGGHIGAVIERVKKGSIADLEGQLKPGDEVLEWNGRVLQGLSHQEVYDIIAESKQEPQVELMVCRTGLSGVPGGGPGGGGGPPGPGRGSAMGRSLPATAHFRAPPVHKGRLVTIVCAAGLLPRRNGEPRNPYAKMYLLPDRSDNSKRRTQTLAQTNDPRWNQTFVYSSVKRSDLKLRVVEITVWDYMPHRTNDFLGEVLVELSVAALDASPEWFYLSGHGGGGGSHHSHHALHAHPLSPTDHLSPPGPPSTTSRLSDSDTSECDLDDGRERRVADGASISSVGSSTSPPPDLSLDGLGSTRRSRRDMSPQGRKRAAHMARDKPVSYQPPRVAVAQLGPRSHSAAPADSPSLSMHSRSRSKSPRRSSDHHVDPRSLSPPDDRGGMGVGGHGYMPRFSRSATATPTTSPRRQLPQIPPAVQNTFRERDRIARDRLDRDRLDRDRLDRDRLDRDRLEADRLDRDRIDLDRGPALDADDRIHMPRHSMRHRGSQRGHQSADWSQQYTGLSDSDLSTSGRGTTSTYRMNRRHRSPDKDIVVGDFGDSDIESVVSVTSSAFSTQSERPRGSRGIRYTQLSTRHVSPHGSLSDTALGTQHNMGGSRRVKMAGGTTGKMATSMGKKSSSTSQLSATVSLWDRPVTSDEKERRKMLFSFEGST